MQIITQLVTPFYLNGVDYEVLEFSVDRQARYQVDGVLTCGKWGEKSTLTDEEHIRVARSSVKASKGRIKVYACAGSNDSRKSLRLAEQLLDCGVDGVSLVLPYYNGGKAREIVKCAEKIKSLANDKRVFMFYEEKSLDKEWSERLKSAGVEIVREDNKWDNTHYSHDKNLLNALCVDGAIFSVLSNVFPSALTHIRRKWEDGNIRDAVNSFFALEDKIEILGLYSVPRLKYALSLWGLSHPSVRSPLIECDEDEKTEIRRFFD